MAEKNEDELSHRGAGTRTVGMNLCEWVDPVPFGLGIATMR
jgi:hypothetical protein